MKKFLLVGAAMVLVFALATSAWAAPHYDNFWGVLSYDNQMIAGGGTGWNGGEWIQYPYAPNVPWWNQWFYDDPPDPNRWKHISYDITLSPGGVDPVLLYVALNWSNLDFGPTGPDGPPPLADEEEFIERALIYGSLMHVGPIHLVGGFDIWEYNPEWVSIDVAYMNPEGYDGYGALNISGSITHECIPEPSSLVLWGVFGALGLLASVWRRRS